MKLKERMLSVTDELNKYPMCIDTANQCVEIAEDFAIGLAEWISENCTTLNIGLWKHIKLDIFVHKNQLLEIYKKENGL